VHIEFDSNETVDRWDDTNTWWDDFVDDSDQAAANRINGRDAIMIGPERRPPRIVTTDKVARNPVGFGARCTTPEDRALPQTSDAKFADAGIRASDAKASCC